LKPSSVRMTENACYMPLWASTLCLVPVRDLTDNALLDSLQRGLTPETEASTDQFIRD
jgi:hypothetical protein